MLRLIFLIFFLVKMFYGPKPSFSFHILSQTMHIVQVKIHNSIATIVVSPCALAGFEPGSSELNCFCAGACVHREPLHHPTNAGAAFKVSAHQD
jgi:hypothetical protein